MNKNLKSISMVLALLIGLLGLTAVVSADSDFYSITSVEIDGTEVFGEDVISGVELDDSIEIRVKIEGTGTSLTCPDGDVDDCTVEAKVKVWIGGYEYDEIETTSSTFDIEPNVSYTKTLTLDLPSDMDVEDNDYTLYVEVYDSEDSEEESYDLFAERPSHSLNIVDVIYDSTVDTGDSMPIEVRVENLGDTKEEDIKVEASLEGLDSYSEYIEELAAFEEDNEDEESSDSADLFLEIPENVETGSYTLTITLTYNRGHEVLEETYTVYINGEESTIEGTTSTVVNIDSTSLQGTQDEDTTTTLTFTNAGSATETYTISANGETQWAASEINPSTITIAHGESQTVSIKMTPDSDASGSYDWSLQILDSEGTLVKDIAMTMNVKEDNGLFDNSSSMLKVGFVILIVLIILIGIIVAFRKMKDDDDDDEDELEPKEGKTYY